jgi:hypothetical protein
MDLFDVIAGKVDLDFIIKHVFPEIQDMPTLKTPFKERKRGNRMIK